MKTSITSYSYHSLYGKDGFTWKSAMDHAKNAGADGFEFSGIPNPEKADVKELAAQVAAYAEEIGLPLVCYAIGADFLKEDLEAEIERVRGEVDIAQILGVPVMRHDVAWGFPNWYRGVRSFGSVVERVAQGCRGGTQYAREKGIRTCSENHGRFVQDSDRVVKLVETVNDTNYGVLCDMGNFLCADDDPAVAVGKVAPITYHVHAKDFLFKPGREGNPGSGWFASRAGNFLRGTIVGHGVVPVAQCLRILKDAGYAGYVTLEFEGLETAPGAISTGLANLKRFIGE